MKLSKIITNSIFSLIAISLIGVAGVVTDYKFTYNAYKIKQINSKLLNAITKNNLNDVKLAIEEGANVNGFDKTGFSFLSCSVPKPISIEITKLLIQNGADVNVFDKNGKTALMRAVSQNDICIDIDKIRLLINEGADVNAKSCDKYEIPVLERSFGDASNVNMNIVRLLVELGADVNGTNNKGFTVLDSTESLNFDGRYNELMDYLKSKGAYYGRLSE